MIQKYFSILIIMAICAAQAVMGQTGNKEMAIEETMIIRLSGRYGTREQKELALEYIGKLLEKGNRGAGKELFTTLEYLALEGTLNRTNRSGIQINNYPDIRQQAVKYLGEIGTKEAMAVLIRICNNDNEPMVLQEAVKSLGRIGINDNGVAVNAIVWATGKNLNSSSPSDILAVVSIITLEQFIQRDKKIYIGAYELLTRITDGRYTHPVKVRARQAIMNIQNQAAGNW